MVPELGFYMLPVCLAGPGEGCDAESVVWEKGMARRNMRAWVRRQWVGGKAQHPFLRALNTFSTVCLWKLAFARPVGAMLLCVSNQANTQTAPFPSFQHFNHCTVRLKTLHNPYSVFKSLCMPSPLFFILLSLRNLRNDFTHFYILVCYPGLCLTCASWLITFGSSGTFNNGAEKAAART